MSTARQTPRACGQTDRRDNQEAATCDGEGLHGGQRRLGGQSRVLQEKKRPELRTELTRASRGSGGD